MRNKNDIQINRVLSYAGFVLVAFQLVSSMIVRPIKEFYKDCEFGEGMPFISYENDILFRHNHEFEACLLYLKDFVKAIDNEDFLIIQELRKHRNDLAHNLIDRISDLKIEEHRELFEDVRGTLFKLSNYRAYVEIGSDPEFKGIDWETLKGHEYILYERIVREIEELQNGAI